VLTLQENPEAAKSTSSNELKSVPDILSAPLSVVVTIKLLLVVLKPYTSAAAIPVRFSPLIAGKVDGNLASGIVPSVKSLASNPAYSSLPVAVEPEPVVLLTFKYLSALTLLSGSIRV